MGNVKKCDLSDFNHIMIVSARQAGLRIPVAAYLLGFSHTTVSGKFCRQKHLATVTQIIARYNCGKQKCISECTTLEVDGLQQWKAMLDSTIVSQEHKTDCSSHSLTKTGQLKTGKKYPYLINLNFY
uniref:Uncharacterized protein n=1 Tax=Erpetoichthys calabaricus TaxID=27687 RepID=A0A8C4T1R3_ERPCA